MGIGASSTLLSRRALLATGLGLAASAAFPRVAGAALGPRLLGCAEVRLAHSGSVAAWKSVLIRHADQEANDFTSCPVRLRFLAASCGARRWEEILAAPFPGGGRQLLETVNERINGEPSMTDSAVWGAEDHWATPREFLALGGDCEDFAIAKFLLLLRLGWPAEALRLAIVQDRRGDGFHAVIAARHGEETLILDNLSADLRPEGDCPHYRPVYAVSDVNLYMYRA